MSEINKNIDQLFLHKSFHELTKEEKLEISEFAKTESEFNDTKMMLISVEKELNNIEEIKPKESTKIQLLADFKKIRPLKPSQPMGLGIFFPSNKPFYRKLGVQIIAIAASIVLIFILIDPSKNTLKQTSETAVIEEDKKVNEDVLTKDLETTKEVAPIEKDELNDLNNNSSNDYLEDVDIVESKELASEKSVLPTPPPPPSNIVISADNEVDVALKESNQATAPAMELAEEGNMVYGDIEEEDDDQDLAIVMDETVSTTVTTGSAKDFSNVNNSPSVDDNITLASSNSSAESENNRGASASEVEKLSQVKTSKTLAENKELIKHFYTAM